MKKSVAAVAILLLLCVPAFAKQVSFAKAPGGSWITGVQILDLPPPPPVPGSETMQPTTPAPTPSQNTPPPPPVPPSTSEAKDLLAGIPENVEALDERVVALEQKVQVVELIPRFEDRLNKAEQQAASAANVVERLDAMQSQLDAIRVDVNNVRDVTSRPYVDSPTFFASIDSLEGNVKTKAILSISLASVALIMVITLLVMGILQHQRVQQQNRFIVVQFLKNYQKQGYPLDMLRMHLAACGWSKEFIESAVKEAGQGL